VLIDQDRIPVRVHSHEAGRPRCALVCLLLKLHALSHQLALQLTDVGELGQLPGVAVPAGVECEDVLLGPLTLAFTLNTRSGAVTTFERVELRNGRGRSLDLRVLESPRDLPVMAASGSGSESLTRLLHAWKDGRQDAGDRVASLVQDDLRRIARRHLRCEGPHVTLSATELINESYLRLAAQIDGFQNREHFFAVAATLMRRVLVDLARKRQAARRGGSDRRVSLDEADVAEAPRSVDLIALDRALDELARFDPTEARIVELHFFGGLSFDEIASALEISPSTVYREWRTARLWLFNHLSAGCDSHASGEMR
jgi:RNA polymerase sigma factor (TIGR02999 family)